ncbi:MAG: adenosylcobinamide-GDP ribazoletransferase [Labedaea sp.]
MAGLRLALSWLTVLPVPAGPVDATTARAAIALAPLVGLLLGGVALGALAAAAALGMPALLAGLLTVGLLALLTRGMHLDGLADTADGLGCYGPPERALALMRDGGAGPFAVVTLIVVLGAQAVALGTLVPSGRWEVVPLALVAGRAAFPLCCRTGVPAARLDGLGALVAGSQPLAVAVAWWLALAVGAAFAVPGHWWLGILAVGLAAATVLAMTAHVRKRFGGITGDVLGAAAELATTVVLVLCTLS